MDLLLSIIAFVVAVPTLVVVFILSRRNRELRVQLATLRRLRASYEETETVSIRGRSFRLMVVETQYFITRTQLIQHHWKPQALQDQTIRKMRQEHFAKMLDIGAVDLARFDNIQAEGQDGFKFKMFSVVGVEVPQ